MKKLITLCMALCMTAALAVSANAADYDFKTEAATGYYKSTCYEDYYDSEYNYGGQNAIDYDIPETRYGLAQQFLEQSLGNPYLGAGIQYGIQPTAQPAAYPVASATAVDAAAVTAANPISIVYTPSVTVDELRQPDGRIGVVSIYRVGLWAKVYEGETNESMAKGAGHYVGSGCWSGNVGLFGHNRGSSAYFGALKDVRLGDTVVYETNQGTRTYEVTFIGSIDYMDHSYLNEAGDNRITLITCIANQPSLRLCVQAVEIH